MSRLKRGMLVAALAAAALAAFAAAAAALRLEVTETRFTMTWPPAEPPGETLRIEVGSTPVSCAITLEGSFTGRTFAKRSGLRIGSITNARLGTCTGGEATVLTTGLPWTVNFRGWGGVLPIGISDIDVTLLGFSINVRPTGSLECLITTEASEPGLFHWNTIERNVFETTQGDNATTIRTNSLLCPLGGGQSIKLDGGLGLLRGGDGITRITLRLI